MAPWPAGYLDQGCDVEPGPNHVVALVCVCLLLAVRAGLRGPSVPRPWTAWPRPDLLRRAGSSRSVQLVEACSSTNTRQIPTLIIPSTRILAVAPTYLISLTPSSENHVPLNYVSVLRRITTVYTWCAHRSGHQHITYVYRCNATRAPHRIVLQLGLVFFF